MKSTRTFLAVLFFLTTVAAVVFALRLYQSNMQLKLQMSDPKTGLEAELAASRKTIRQLQDQLTALRLKKNPAADASETADDNAPADNGGSNRVSRRAAFMAVLNSPQFQALRALQQKVQLDSRYADLFKTLVSQYNLTPAQIDQFKSLLIQREQARQDAVQAAMQNGLNPRTDRAGFNAAVQAATGDVDAQIKSTIGDAGFQQYQTFDSTTQERQTVTQLQQSLSYTGAALTDAQTQQLTTLLQQSQGTNKDPGAGRGMWFGGGPGGMVGGVPITQQVITQASTFLAPAQVQALQQIQQAQQAQKQMGQLLQQANQSRKAGKG